MPAPDAIVQKVQQFDLHYDQYHSPAFSEAEARVQFIDPFFKALGWDMDNSQGFAEQYKELSREGRLQWGRNNDLDSSRCNVVG